MWEDWGSAQLEVHETLFEKTKGNKTIEQKKPPPHQKKRRTLRKQKFILSVVMVIGDG